MSTNKKGKDQKRKPQANLAAYEIVTDFEPTLVANEKLGERPDWDGFRIWESVKYPIPIISDHTKYRRVINTLGNPAIDIMSDWLMDFSTIAAGQLRRTDWYNFRNLVLVQVPRCNSGCWYCFNDAWKPKCICAPPKTAKEIIDHFIQQHDRDQKYAGLQKNVLRLSGGEPFLEPLLVRDLAFELKKKINKYGELFFWIDTNLVFDRRKELHIDLALEALCTLGDHVAVHACFHGHDDSSFRAITGIKTYGFADLVDNFKKIEATGIRVYPRFNPCAFTPSQVEELFIKFYDIDETLPLRIYLGILEFGYQATAERMLKIKEAALKNKRKMPFYHSPQASIYSWDKMMQLAYGIGYGVLPRHLCSFNNKKKNPFIDISSSVLKEKNDKEKAKLSKEVLFISKGSYREIYALKLVESLSRPFGDHVTVEYNRTYVEPNLFNFLNVFPDQYKGKDVLITATHPFHRDNLHMVFLRWGKLVHIANTSVSTTLEIELGYYPFSSSKTANKENYYELMARYLGRRNLPLDGYFVQLAGLPGFQYPVIDDIARTHQDEAFFQIIECLTNSHYSQLNRNIYYRISDISKSNGNKVNLRDGRLIVNPGDEIIIKLASCNPYLGTPGFPEEDIAILRVSTTNKENLMILSGERIRLSKYSQHVIKIRLPEEDIEFKGEIIIGADKEVKEARLFETILALTCESREV